MPKKQHFWKKNMVANFGFNCKNGKVSPILRLHAITRVRITPKLNFCPKFCQKWSFKFNLIISNVWCQIVLVPNCPVPNCPVPNCPTTVQSVFRVFSECFQSVFRLFSIQKNYVSDFRPLNRFFWAWNLKKKNWNMIFQKWGGGC